MSLKVRDHQNILEKEGGIKIGSNHIYDHKF